MEKKPKAKFFTQIITSELKETHKNQYI